MTREIKFRAWNKERQVMGPVFGMKEIWAGPKAPSVSDFKEYVILQFTGLLDKNGKEIYEGDIVKKNEDGAYRVVTYEDGRFAPYPWTYRLWHEQCEVIGNIYENPELLKT